MRKNTMKKMKTHNKGYTLIEVLVSITLLSVAGVMMLQASGNSLSAVNRVEIKTQALFHARSIMEKYMSDTELTVSEDVFDEEIDDQFAAKVAVVEYPVEFGDENDKLDHHLIKIIVRVYSIKNDKLSEYPVYTLKSLKPMLKERTDVPSGL